MRIENSPPPSMNPSNIYMWEKFSLNTNWKLTRRILYNQACKVSTWNLVGNEDIILGPVPFGAGGKGDYRAEIIPKE